MKKSYFLFLLFSSFVAFGQQTYQIQSIPHQLYQGNATIQYSQDDINSSSIAIPFTFNFFGVDYQNLVISSNGYVTFDNTSANSFSPFSFAQPIPNVNFPVKNAVFGIYHDLYNNIGLGNYLTGINGVAPHRKFVVYFKNIAHFSCPSVFSTTQIILYEGTNIIDIQVQEKALCGNWNNGGKALLGVLNSNGDKGYAPTDRNTGIWTALNEGWRFVPFVAAQPFAYSVCNTNDTFNLNSVLSGVATNATFYASELDAINNTNVLSNDFVPTSNPQTIYALLNNGTTDMVTVIFNSIDCEADTDSDSIATALEDLNGDGNLENDDTDGDGIPNYQDNDDDGDLVLTDLELINLEGGRMADATGLDTDNDGILNYLDIDDDGDGIITINEDYNNNGDVSDDDVNANGIPDYLDLVVLGIDDTVANIFNLTVYPNPVTDKVNFKANLDFEIQSVKIVGLNGQIVADKFYSINNTTFEIDTNSLPSGIYLIVIKANNSFYTRKISKN